MITIKDIAADAKVSVSTVSRVMNGSKAVSDELRHRVMRSIEKYHYIPNAEARSLVTKNTHLVAVLEADLRNPITAIHLKQISDVCMKHNKVVIACDYDFDNSGGFIYIPQQTFRNIKREKTFFDIKVEITGNKMERQGFPFFYIGYAEPLEKLVYNEYITRSASGFVREKKNNKFFR